VSNFRSFKEAQLSLSNVNFLIGPNSTGKSKILEIFKIMKSYLLRQSSLYQYNNIIHKLNNILELVFSFQFSLDDNERNFIINNSFHALKEDKDSILEKFLNSEFSKNIFYSLKFNDKGLSFENISIENIDGKNFTVLGQLFNEKTNNLEAYHQELNYNYNEIKSILTNMKISEESKIVLSGKQTNDRILTYNKLTVSEEYILNLIKNFFLNVKWFEPYRIINFDTQASEEKELSSSGDNLVRLLNALVGEDPEQFVMYTDFLRRIFPFIEKFSSPLRGNKAIFRFKEEGIGKQLNFEEASTGMHQGATTLLGLLTLENPSLILLEEPEAHIHATVQRQLLQYIKKFSTEAQFLIATHSTIFTGCDEICSTFLFTKRNGISSIREIHEPKEMKLVKYSLGHKNTDLFNDVCVVFIEGKSEKLAFPIIAKALGYDFTELGIRLINFEGGSKHTKLEEYLKYLKGSDVKPFIIADGDKRVKEKLPDWVRSDLIHHDNCYIWEKEFEDCFEPSIITEAFNHWLKEEECLHEIEKSLIDKNIYTKKSIVHFLKKYIYENSLPDLDKPALAEHLANIIVDKKTIEEIKNTPIGKALSKIAETAILGAPIVAG